MINYSQTLWYRSLFISWQTNNAETAEIVSNLGGTCRTYKCDVTKRKEVADVAARVRDDLGQVDILVNNAGIMICKSILDLSEKEIQKTMDVNILAHFWVSENLILNFNPLNPI